MTPRVIRWEDPPPCRNSSERSGRPPGSEWNGVAEQLKDERGRWAVVFEGEREQALTVRKFIVEARRVCFRPMGDFEACIRALSGVHTIYARYMGDDFS